ncbi:hypothetical protein [Dactylosporangium cerinum]
MQGLLPHRLDDGQEPLDEPARPLVELLLHLGVQPALDRVEVLLPVMAAAERAVQLGPGRLHRPEHRVDRRAHDVPAETLAVALQVDGERAHRRERRVGTGSGVGHDVGQQELHCLDPAPLDGGGGLGQRGVERRRRRVERRVAGTPERDQARLDRGGQVGAAAVVVVRELLDEPRQRRRPGGPVVLQPRQVGHQLTLGLVDAQQQRGRRHALPAEDQDAGAEAAHEGGDRGLVVAALPVQELPGGGEGELPDQRLPGQLDGEDAERGVDVVATGDVALDIGQVRAEVPSAAGSTWV